MIFKKIKEATFMVFQVLPISICTQSASINDLPTNQITSLNIFHHLLSTFWFFFLSYIAFMPTSDSSSYAFNSINNTRQKNVKKHGM